MLSSDGTTAPSHRELMWMYQDAFELRVEKGEVRPAVFPHDGYGLFALLIYLCIPHVNRPWLYAARWAVLAFIVMFDLKLILETRTTYDGMGFGVGLVAAWGLVWSMTWLVWNAPQFDAMRVQRKEKKASLTGAKPPVIEKIERFSSKKAAKVDGGLTKRQQQQNGQTKAGEQKSEQEEAKEEAYVEYYWQSYPAHSLRDRIGWIIDLIFNFRGPGWNWEVSSNPSLPARIKVGLGEPVDLKSMQIKSPAGIKRFRSQSELFRSQIPRFIVGYLLLDALKVFLMKDPYFTMGPNEFPPPEHLASLSPGMLSVFRRALSMIAIIVALETIFILAPIFLCLILGPKYLGARGEFWMYPTTWGSLDTVFKKGLQGFWGGWWHQTFRYAFSAPTNFLIRHKIIKPKSLAAKLIGLIVAFGISGFLHGSGSYTQIANTNPANPALFFMLQLIGILIQTSFCGIFKPWIQGLSTNVRSSGNFAFAFTWLYCTSPLLIDDFARGGLWLFQPVPISLFRALGYGEEGDSWWCWEGIRLHWYEGKHWWESGLTL